ncbi:MAG: GMC family oxidoreductase [Planctomycetota bacterium]
MLVDNPDALANLASAPDRVVVIGAGAVGLHVAVEIANQGREVVVLEAGNRRLDSFGEDAYEVVGRRHDGARIGRSVALGGTSNLWGGQLVEYMPIDLEGREWLDGSRWPIRFEELAAYYPRSYELLGVGAESQRDESVWQGIGKQPPSLGEGLEVILTRWMKVPNVASHFSKQIEENDNLRVVLESRMVGFSGDGERVTGVRVVDAAGGEHVIPGQDFVLAAGTIENARLLLHTAQQDDWQCPWRDNDNVGRYFQDHLGGRLAYIKPRNARRFFDAFCTIVQRGGKFQPKVRVRNDVLNSQPILSNQAMISFESSVKENLVFLKQFVKAALSGQKVGSFWQLVKSLAACGRHMVPLMWKFVVEHRILIPSGSRISLTLQGEVLPLRESRVLIDSDQADAHGLPRALLDWRVDGRELQDIKDFVDRVRVAFDEAGLADLEVEPGLASLDPAFLNQLRDTNHPSGGCVMGESEEDGVVDKNLRVFGVENLYVAGASVFRTNSNANVTFTAMTLGTRLAEHLTQKSRAAG